MEQYLKTLLAGIRQWVNGKIEDISFVIASHIVELSERMSAVEQAIEEGGTIGPTGATGATGPQGETGRGFHIDHTYASISAMEGSTGATTGDFAMIITSDEHDEDYGKVYIKTENSWAFQVDMSVVGATGIIGPTGATGPAGTYTAGTGIYIDNGVIGITGVSFTVEDVVAELTGTTGTTTVTEINPTPTPSGGNDNN